MGWFIVRLKFQKRSELKFVSRTIPQSGGYKTPQLALGFYTRDKLSLCHKIKISVW
jgi:hypothetical protein